MKTLVPAVMLSAALMSSCALNTDKAAGMNSRELQALKQTYYWEDRYDPPTFAPGELESLMDRSANPMLDGEYAESQASAVAAALATVGDERFAKTLANRSPDVQTSVIRNVRYMWTHYELDYPMTRAIESKKKENKSATPRKPSD